MLNFNFKINIFTKNYLFFIRKKRVSIQSIQQPPPLTQPLLQDNKMKMSNSISQSKMEAKVVATQTAATMTNDIKPQQQHTPDHKTYVTEMRKELSEAATGHFMVRCNRNDTS